MLGKAVIAPFVRFVNFRSKSCLRFFNAGKCPSGFAWADIASGRDVAHQLTECSSRGECNHETGTCECMPGYEGIACSRSESHTFEQDAQNCTKRNFTVICPGDCNGHGRCRTMKSHAQRMMLGRPRFTYSDNWDAQMVHGCECDEGWSGYDCTERKLQFICDFALINAFVCRSVSRGRRSYDHWAIGRCPTAAL